MTIIFGRTQRRFEYTPTRRAKAGRKGKTMLIDTLKNELERAYRVLSADNADMLNSRDILVWEREHYINAEQAMELRTYNKKLYQEQK